MRRTGVLKCSFESFLIVRGDPYVNVVVVLSNSICIRCRVSDDVECILGFMNTVVFLMFFVVLR